MWPFHMHIGVSARLARYHAARLHPSTTGSHFALWQREQTGASYHINGPSTVSSVHWTNTPQTIYYCMPPLPSVAAWMIILLPIRPLDVPCNLPLTLAGLAFSLIISFYVQLYTWHDVGLMLTTTTRWQKQTARRRAADCESIRLHCRLHGTNAVIWRSHFHAMSLSPKHTPRNW